MMKKMMMGQLEDGTVLFGTNDRTLQFSADWTHFDGSGAMNDAGWLVAMEGGPSDHGWVRSKYIKPIKCPEREPELKHDEVPKNLNQPGDGRA
jgi:hypothetical protein